MQNDENQPTAASPIKPVAMKRFNNGMTVKDLKELLRDWPEIDDYTGEDCEVWLENKEGLTSPCHQVTPLNKRGQSADILLSS